MNDMSNMPRDHRQIWKDTLTKIRKEISDQEFVTWFNQLDYESANDNEIILRVPSKFIKDQIRHRYQKKLISYLKEIAGSSLTLSYIIRKDASLPGINASPSEAANPVNTQTDEKGSTSSLPIPEVKMSHENGGPKHPNSSGRRNLEDIYSTSYSFDSFVVGDSNSFAFNACLAIAKNPGTTYNPCLIYGGVGLGKTHLLQSIRNYVFIHSPGIEPKYVTAETFINEFIESVGERKTQQFKNKYRKADILLIDDIHFLQSKTASQEELFHTFNDLYETNRQMVFTCDRPVSELRDLTARLRSRFERGLNVDLQPPDLETRIAILKKKCQEQDYEVSDDVLTFICEHINTNVRDLESSLTKLIAYSKLLNRKISVDIAREQLKDSYSLNREQSVAIETIQRVVAEYFNLSYLDLRGKKRTRAVSLPRQIAMFVARKITDYSTTEIGYEFGGRDHTTVMHACQRIEGLLQSDPTIDTVIQKMIRAVHGYRRS